MKTVKMTPTLLYFAYGANTNKRSMALRCPQAKPLEAVKLEGWRLHFRGVADIMEREGSVVHGALWRITPECEAALDRFEGFPNTYIKQYGQIRVNGRSEVVMMYVMRQARALCPPHESYRQCLLEGYREFGIDTDQIHYAVRRAYNSLGKRKQSDWLGYDTDLSGRY